MSRQQTLFDHATAAAAPLDVNGLKFKVMVNASEFAVLGLWKGEELPLASGKIKPFEGGKEFVIDDFFYEGPNSFSKYYKDISTIAKASKRTVAGIVMEIIKGAMAEGDRVKVKADGWIGLQGPATLRSALLILAAREMLGEGDDDDEEEDDLQEAKAYLEYRYKRLFPKEEMSKDAFLRNISGRGWYGAWLPDVSTEKKDVITTAVSCNK